MPFKLTKLIQPAALSAGIMLASFGAAHAANTGIYGNWITERIQGHKVSAKIKSTLDIAKDGNISGNAGCNQYMGGMEIKGDKIKVLPGGATLMACPPALMKQDSQFHGALGTVTGWKISNGKLILMNAKKREVLRLKRA
ncbi:META domain-containing protein [Bacillus subtilis]|uniref:META domain-containing protein n=1 Tax=Pseudochrobactrum asaccharolyticum TaxID=354351 RepID=UPI001F2D00EC|nr:META domain-containing protein [Pseudochrobactrum asaccharolyticum]MCF7645792.1 META domain-containing protein [Pseudochrobactrum asaccharolyticum]MCF7671142.1 META domain-containing protein [Bacillus subtilis]